MSHLWDLALWLIILTVGFEAVVLFCAYALAAWQFPQPFLAALIVAVSLAVLAACYVAGRAVTKHVQPTE